MTNNILIRYKEKREYMESKNVSLGSCNDEHIKKKDRQVGRQMIDELSK